MKEIWKDIAGCEGSYQVSNLGRVKSRVRAGVKKERILKQKIQKRGKGYYIVHLRVGPLGVSKHPLVHRLVAKAFIPNPENKPQVNHVDGNTRNNNVDNLEWATSQENVRHCYDVLGHKPHNCREVLCIETGEIFDSVAEASITKSVSASTIAGCCRGDYGRRTAGGYHWRYS